MLMTETAIPELVAISYHSSQLCDAFTSVTSITWFAQKLEETGFITRQASSNVLGTTGCGDQEKCFRLLDAVKVQVGAKRDMFKSFVDILNSEAALSIYAEMVFNSYETEARRNEAERNKRLERSNSSAPGHAIFPKKNQDTICLPIFAFGIMMRDITQVLHVCDTALENMLITFEQMAYFMKSETYIAVVQSKEYKSVDSVRTLFQLLAPHWKPVDYSLLSSLVFATGSEKAIRRLQEYISKTESLVLGRGGEKMYVPVETETLCSSDALGTVTTPNLESNPARAICSQPVSKSDSVNVIVRVEKDKISWGGIRNISSLLCGMFRLPPYALQYDEANPGSVVIKWVLSRGLVGHIRSIVLSDDDKVLLEREAIQYITVDSKIFYKDFFMEESKSSEAIGYKIREIGDMVDEMDKEAVRVLIEKHLADSHGVSLFRTVIPGLILLSKSAWNQFYMTVHRIVKEFDFANLQKGFGIATELD